MVISIACKGNAEPVSVIASPVPVFTEVGRDGELSGYTIELIRGMLAQAGLEGHFRPEPFARMMSDLKAHPSQIGASLVRTPEREDKFFWITPVTATSNQLYIKKDSVYAQSGVSSLSQLSSVAVMRDDYRHAILTQANVSNVLAVNTWEQAIETLLRDRVEGVLFSSIGVRLICKQALLDCTNLIPAYTTGTPVSYIVLPRNADNAELAEKLTMAAEQFKRSDTFAALARKTNKVFASFGLSAGVDDGVMHISDTNSVDASEHIWVLGELSGDFAKLNSRREMVGYNADLVRAILLEAEIEAPILAVPWQRLMREALQKPNVLAFAVARTPEREAMFHWITPITHNEYGLYSTEKRKYRNIARIPKDRVVGTIKRDFRSDIARAAGLITTEFETWGEAINALYREDIDFVFASPWAIGVGCQQSNHPCEDVSLSTRYNEITTWLVLSKSNTDSALVEKLQRAAESLKQSDKYQLWAERWAADINQRTNANYSVKDGIMYLYNVNQNQ